MLPHKPGKTTAISVVAISTLYSGVPGMVQVTHELKLQEMDCTLMRRTEHSSERPLESMISVNLAKAKADCCVCVSVSGRGDVREWSRKQREELLKLKDNSGTKTNVKPQKHVGWKFESF